MSNAHTTSVTLRQRQLTSGKQSLYVDVYHLGHRHYHYLSLYILPEYTTQDHLHNLQVITQAKQQLQAIRCHYDIINHQLAITQLKQRLNKIR